MMIDSQLLRYSRHLFLPQIDIEGQTRLLGSSVLVVGLGGLGSPAVMYLAAAGVGHLIVNDFDQVDLCNLQRQILHDTQSIGLAKTQSALRMLHRLNPDVKVTCINKQLCDEELEQVILKADVVLDCSDNLRTRFAVNRACHRQRKRLVTGAVIRFEGQFASFYPGVGDSPCYNCLYPRDFEEQDTCSESGVVAPLPGIIGSMQALEAIKMLTMQDYAGGGKLLLLDAFTMEWQSIRLSRNPHCSTCGMADVGEV